MSITALTLPATALVFQCGACKTILSDSREFVCTLIAPGLDAAKCVAVKAVSEARLDRIPHTSAAGSDEATTYYSLCCTGCGAVVGRLYTQLPQQLEAVRNLFCLEASRCLSYELGGAEVRAPGAGSGAGGPQGQQQPSSVQQGAGQQLQGDGADEALVLDLVQRVEHLEASLITLQGMQLLHDGQLRTLPGYQGGVG